MARSTKDARVERISPRRLARPVAAILAASIVFLLLPASPSAAASEAEGTMRKLINAERTERGKAPLAMNARLVTVARQHSKRMADDGTIYHNGNLSSQVSYCDPSEWGENVGMGGSVGRLHDLFMDSTPHRKNILKGAFDRVGVGIVRRDDTLFVTVVFVAN
jgi:uncharacterized protein YkwD